MPYNPPPAEIAVGLIVAADGRLLLQHRDDIPGLHAAGLWGLFGGHLEPGETPEQAFAREIEEETGWRPQHFELFRVRQITSTTGEHLTSHVFAAHLNVAIDALVLGEGQGLALCPPGALPVEMAPGLPALIVDFVASDLYGRMMRCDGIRGILPRDDHYA